MTKIENNTVARVHYTGTLPDSESRLPLLTCLVLHVGIGIPSLVFHAETPVLGFLHLHSWVSTAGLGSAHLAEDQTLLPEEKAMISCSELQIKGSDPRKARLN